ncbi:transcriptional modulator of MazE/toxin, MazF [Stanieria cyanosphaera PCC 7437]|uniref:Transcriptional modulator of MazE/toxin, MazF n=1 Tax=Stanieria cyanosphaera (strain ATCC 29371 / PCC 7437) TaxID=111780 RepID=K9Y0A2_STAC7|nr:type II toxin-antitoxin system PemK/MazF family toxin [Stanieria cyanosphaera]AFZ37816.1 transcriptional modulator of MazE/toxin, MazF [Stanieria cyanosphaera PCC 7437]
MAAFVKGDVVIVPFPFSDLSQAKRRPVLVIATFTGDDLILCQITSQAVTDSYAVAVTNNDFTTGGLNQNSNIRPNRLFTADRGLILYKAGQLTANKLKEVIDKIINILQ